MESIYYRLKDRAAQISPGNGLAQHACAAVAVFQVPRELPREECHTVGLCGYIAELCGYGWVQEHCTTSCSTALAGLKPQISHSHTALLLQDPNQYLCEQYLRQPVPLEQNWLHLWHSQCTARLDRYITCVGALGGKSRLTSYIQLYTVSQPRYYLWTGCSILPSWFSLSFSIRF